MQAAAEPQRQTPPVQALARAVSQATHAAPLEPHWASVAGVTQLGPAQHPVQVAGSHTHAPATHRWFAPHEAPRPHLHAPPAQLSALAESQARHAPPLAPHCVRVAGETQAAASQHPPHVAGSQAQLPPVHS
jgi:hypothetical protein